MFYMKKTLLTLLLGFPIFMHAQTAKIKIDITRIIEEIYSKIYGVFIEPISFSCKTIGLPYTAFYSTLYGNLYNPKSPLAEAYDFRKDYIKAIKALKIININKISYSIPTHSFV